MLHQGAGGRKELPAPPGVERNHLDRPGRVHQTAVVFSSLRRFLAAELLAFGAFVFGGLAWVGFRGVLEGETALAPGLALGLVAIFSLTALLLAASSLQQVRSALRGDPRPTGVEGGPPADTQESSEA